MGDNDTTNRDEKSRNLSDCVPSSSHACSRRNRASFARNSEAFVDALVDARLDAVCMEATNFLASSAS